MGLKAVFGILHRGCLLLGFLRGLVLGSSYSDNPSPPSQVHQDQGEGSASALVIHSCYSGLRTVASTDHIVELLELVLEYLENELVSSFVKRYLVDVHPNATFQID